MNDQNPTPPATPPAPAPTPSTPTSTSTSSTSGKRFAAYDKDYLRFVGGVHDTKAAARDEAKAKGVKNHEIREV